ncbi:hypothetical protein ACHAPJ_009294 [Fusarium lateritium]
MTKVAEKASSNIFHRSLTKDYPEATGGQGVYIIKSDGTKVLDGSSGAAVSCLGHGHPDVIEAIIEQAKGLAFAHTSFFTNDPSEKLASFLINSSEGAFSKVLFLSSGSEAVESALKLGRQYHLAKKNPERVNFISRNYSYHGNTIGALSAGFNPLRRQAFEPLLSTAFHHVSPCFYTRDAGPGETEYGYVDRLIKEYEDMFLQLGPETVAAVILEPVSGATLGAVPAAAGYLDRNSAPDLQTIGKGLGAGYQPISAVLVRSKVHQSIKASQTERPFVSGHTYQGHAIGCAAALATQQVILRDNLLGSVQKMGDLLAQQLKKTPKLKEVRGLGLFLTVEFATEPGARIAPDVAEACLRNGAAVYLCSPSVDALMVAPPFIINEREVGILVDIFIKSVTEVLDGKQRKLEDSRI